MNLKGPWKYEWLSYANDNATEHVQSGTAKMPQGWQSLFGNRSGRVQFSRVFHQPSNLDANEQVYVVFDGVGGDVVVSVNGVNLGSKSNPSAPFGFDVTPLLRPTNKLVATIDFKVDDGNDQPGGLWAPVGIEIRKADTG